MAVQQVLIDAIDALLGQGIFNPYTTKSAVFDIFEGYSWSIILTAAREAGAEIRYEDRRGKSVNSLTLRSSPSSIFTTRQNFTHAVIEFQNCPILEAHVGIYVRGNSGVLHEYDVAVIDRAEARRCRSKQISPRSSKVEIGVECKFYSASLPLGVGRSFIGLAKDSRSKSLYLVTNVESQSIEKLISHHGVEWEMRLDTKDPEAADRLRTGAAAHFRKFKARNS